uniref:Collagen-like protein n=1 Tax=viral metagenome TaxID=1070528 RepID=A0A6C0EKG2_9ZZZZ
MIVYLIGLLNMYLFMNGCSRAEGPAGAAGPAGPAGPTGPAGADGA